MTEQAQFKRNIAFKFRIGDLLLGKPVIEEEKFKALELGDKKIVRVNLVGNIVEKYENEGEKKYVFFTLDDGTGQMKLRVFGDDYERFKDVNQGETVLIIGVLRHWNNETYVTPEIIRTQDPKYLLIRKLEMEKERNSIPAPVEKAEIGAIKDKIIELIKKAEEQGGMEMDQMIMELRETSPEAINQEVQKLIEEGIVFEPRPGKVRYLG